jgi:hypothetical protein
MEPATGRRSFDQFVQCDDVVCLRRESATGFACAVPSQIEDLIDCLGFQQKLLYAVETEPVPRRVPGS